MLVFRMTRNLFPIRPNATVGSCVYPAGFRERLPHPKADHSPMYNTGAP